MPFSEAHKHHILNSTHRAPACKFYISGWSRDTVMQPWGNGSQASRLECADAAQQG